jgi:hypothetical protein
MQSTIHHLLSDPGVDVHAPAKTYYTTGNNSGGSISRLTTLKKEKSQGLPPRKRRASYGMIYIDI